MYALRVCRSSDAGGVLPGLHSLSLRQNLLTDASELDQSASKTGEMQAAVLSVLNM